MEKRWWVLLRKRPFIAGLSMAVLLFAGTGGLMLILSLFLQLGPHFSALHTGLALALVALGMSSRSPPLSASPSWAPSSSPAPPPRTP
jgi:hypothetical protein